MNIELQAKHAHLDVQRVAIRCLGLFGLLEYLPSEELIKQLRVSYIKGPDPISIEACKALFDIGMWHGPQEVDRLLMHDHASQIQCDKNFFCAVNFSDPEGNPNVGVLDLLYGGFEIDDWGDLSICNEDECVLAVLGEGFAKILLLSQFYSSVLASLHPVLLSKLITLFFGEETESQR